MMRKHSVVMVATALAASTLLGSSLDVQRYKAMLDISPQAYAKQFEQKSGLYIDLKKGGPYHWKDAAKACLDRGMSLPGMHDLRTHVKDLEDLLEYSVVQDCKKTRPQRTKHNFSINLLRWCDPMKLIVMLSNKAQDSIDLRSLTPASSYYDTSGAVDKVDPNAQTEYLMCKAHPSSKELARLQKMLHADAQKAKELQKRYHFTQPLQVWQTIVDPKTRMKDFKRFASAPFSMQVGFHDVRNLESKRGAFISPPQGYGNFSCSKNFYLWAMKPTKEQIANALKGYGKCGLTQEGFKAYAKLLQSQPLFQALSNKDAKEAANGHKIVVSGTFKDKKGKTHEVELHFFSGQTLLTIDWPYNLF